MTSLMPPPLAPERVSGGRIAWIDSVRALALLGVIIMNYSAMQMRFAGREIMAEAGIIDLAVMAIDLAVVQGKARACFAFLFGFGFATMMIRIAAKDGEFVQVYVRRMLALLGIGMINQAFLWWGDILVLYALLGLAMLPLRTLSNRAMLGLGVIMILVPPLAIGALEVLNGGPLGAIVSVDPAVEAARGLAAMTSTSYLDFVRFSFSQALERRLTDTPHMIIYDANVLGLFLLGAWAARLDIGRNVVRFRAMLRKTSWIAIPVGLAFSLISASRLAGFSVEGPLYGLVTAASVGLPLLAIGYLAALALLFHRRCASLRRLLAPAGRMTLTNYVASGAIGCWIFYGYGLAMLGEFGIAATTLLAAGVFAGLTAASHLWLARFRLGPLEQLWRWISYGGHSTDSQGTSTVSRASGNMSG